MTRRDPFISHVDRRPTDRSFRRLLAVSVCLNVVLLSVLFYAEVMP